jgi:ParB/RepB/Spo0J family partition protein
MPPTIEAPTKRENAKGANSRTSNGHKPQGHQTTVKPRASQAKPHAASHQWLVVPLPVELIEPSPYQPRLSFDAEEMAELVASVRAKGVQQPIIVQTCKVGNETLQNGASHAALATANGKVNGARNGASKPNLVRYELIAGERRLRACKEAGRRHIPAIVRDDLSDAECAELALLENVQRSNLSVIEEARGYKRLMLHFRLKEERIAKKVGKSVGTIRDLLKLLQLPESVQKLIANKKLTASHGHELLALMPYERVCVLVAEKAAKDHLTALSLQTTPLPNVPDLKRLGLVAELDWRTKFDWKSECGKCPHKAYVTSSYGAYCLKPDEWNRKQAAAIERQKQEAARVMEEARQQKGQPVEVEKLTPGSFRNLTHNTPAAGCCGTCPCRGEMEDAADPTKRIPICLDPARYNELVKAERQANEDARREKYLALWQQARDVLKTDVEDRSLNRLATLIALPVLQAAFCRYVDGEQWASLTRTVGASVGIFVPWDDLLDDEKGDFELYEMLSGQLEAQAPEKLLLLCACLLLAYEANQVVRFSGETPGIDFALGLTPARQTELEEDHEGIEITKS